MKPCFSHSFLSFLLAVLYTISLQYMASMLLVSLPVTECPLSCGSALMMGVRDRQLPRHKEHSESIFLLFSLLHPSTPSFRIVDNPILTFHLTICLLSSVGW